MVSVLVSRGRKRTHEASQESKQLLTVRREKRSGRGVETAGCSRGRRCRFGEALPVVSAVFEGSSEVGRSKKPVSCPPLPSFFLPTTSTSTNMFRAFARSTIRQYSSGPAHSVVNGAAPEVSGSGEAFIQAREAVEHHAAGSAELWRKITYVLTPLTTYNPP